MLKLGLSTAWKLRGPSQLFLMCCFPGPPDLYLGIEQNWEATN